MSSSDRRERWWQNPVNYIWILLAVAVVSVVISVGRWFYLSSQGSLPIRVPMTPIGRAISLIDGTGLDEWQIMSGDWAAETDDGGLVVLTGSNGEIARPLPLHEDEQRQKVAPEYYRIQFVVDPLAASAIDLHHQLGPDGTRWVARIDSSGARLGRQPPGAAKFEYPPGAVQLSRPWPSPHTVKIEQLPTGMFINIDGQDVQMSPPWAQPRPELRLRVVDGPAEFSELEIEELTPDGAARGP